MSEKTRIRLCLIILMSLFVIASDMDFDDKYGEKYENYQD